MADELNVQDYVINVEHEKAILKHIKENDIYSVKDIFVSFTGCSRGTFYNHNLDKLNSIKEAIELKKRKGVSTMLSKWIASENPTLQLAAMRMLCEPEEHRLLNQNYTELRGTLLNSSPLTMDEIKKARENLNNEL